MDVDRGVVINEPRRKRNMIVQGESRNGAGWEAWALGWPGLSRTEATVLAVLADGHRRLGEIFAAAIEIRARRIWGDVSRGVMASALVTLKDRGLVERLARGLYRASALALETRGPVWPFTAMRETNCSSRDTSCRTPSRRAKECDMGRPLKGHPAMLCFDCAEAMLLTSSDRLGETFDTEACDGCGHIRMLAEYRTKEPVTRTLFREGNQDARDE